VTELEAAIAERRAEHEAQARADLARKRVASVQAAMALKGIAVEPLPNAGWLWRRGSLGEVLTEAQLLELAAKVGVELLA